MHVFTFKISKAKCLSRLKFISKIRIFCKYTSYKVNLKDYGKLLELLPVQYIFNINNKKPYRMEIMLYN